MSTAKTQELCNALRRRLAVLERHPKDQLARTEVAGHLLALSTSVETALAEARQAQASAQPVTEGSISQDIVMAGLNLSKPETPKQRGTTSHAEEGGDS